MKKLALTAIALSVSCISATAQKSTPTFEFDPATDNPQNDCNAHPVVSGNSVTFGSGPDNSTVGAGRAVSQHKYKNITRITATYNLKDLTQNFVNASYYLIANPTHPDLRPIGSDYCDAGGNHTEWNCREIDIVETNGNKISQTTLHLGNGGPQAPQRYEYSFAATANNSCFNFSSMQNAPQPQPPKDSTNGLHSLVKPVGQGKNQPIDMNKPFDVITDFKLGTKPSMKTTFQQGGGQPYVVYDTNVGSGAEGSGTLDLQDLNTTMQNDGYWVVVSFWQGYSPTGPGSSPWWNDSCSHGVLCNTAVLNPPAPPSNLSITNVVVYAGSQSRPIERIFVPR
jgi:hypothetical protein